jgi:predicted MFS family arabinose efflux permease
MTAPSPGAARWWVLAAYAWLAGMSQLLWLNFAPLLGQIQTRYGVSEFTAGLLLMVFPLLYVVLSLPAGTLTDRRGYRFAVGAGAWVMAASSALRIWDASFWTLLAGQVGIAIAQPFIVNGITKLVAEWFPQEHGALANGLGTMGMFLGMAVGMAVTPPLVEAVGMPAAMAVFAAATSASAAAFTLSSRGRGAYAHQEGAPVVGEIRSLLRDRRLLLLLALSAIGLGVFNGLSTWLEELLRPSGLDATQAGLVGGALIVGGIVGAVVVPALSDRSRRRRPFLILCLAISPFLCFPLTRGGSFGAMSAVAFGLGFFSMPSFALMLDMCAQVAGAERAGGATALLMLTGNAGGVALIALVPALKQPGGYWLSSALMVGLLALGALLATRMPETFPGAGAGATPAA